MRYFKKLLGERLYLSPVNAEDYLRYTEWINDPSTSMPLGTYTSTFSIPREKELLETMLKDDNNFAIVKIEGDELIGNCSIFGINQIHRTAEVGLFIGNESKRGKGFGKEALLILLEFGFKCLNLNNIMLRAFSFNERGIAAYKSIGFKEFGRRHQAFVYDHKFYDQIHMEYLASDFSKKIIKNLPI